MLNMLEGTRRLCMNKAVVVAQSDLERVLLSLVPPTQSGRHVRAVVATAQA
jgi:hypothetical protein